jgi:hypothetical protein
MTSDFFVGRAILPGRPPGEGFQPARRRKGGCSHDCLPRLQEVSPCQ